MSEIEMYDEDMDDTTDDELEAANDQVVGPSSTEVRRRIEELLERKRLREEFGDLDF